MGKNSLEEQQISEKLTPEDKKAIQDKASEIINWLDNNQSAEIDEFEDKKKELESVANPIMTKMYQGAQGGAQGGMTNMGDMPNMSKNSNGGAGPTIEEVD